MRAIFDYIDAAPDSVVLAVLYVAVLALCALENLRLKRRVR